MCGGGAKCESIGNVNLLVPMESGRTENGKPTSTGSRDMHEFAPTKQKSQISSLFTLRSAGFSEGMENFKIVFGIKVGLGVKIVIGVNACKFHCKNSIIVID